MANDKYIERIKQSARFLATPTAIAARGYLDSPLEAALKVLDCFADGEQHDYEEIAEMTGMHKNTVSQIIRALDEGGFPLKFSYSALTAKTGRKPIIIRSERKRKT